MEEMEGEEVGGRWRRRSREPTSWTMRRCGAESGKSAEADLMAQLIGRLGG